MWEKENKPVLFAENNDDESAVQSLIEQAIDKLPSRRKQVYLLSRHERLTYNEIASRLGISKESVKTHLKLASASITTFLHAHLQDILFLSVIVKSFF